MWTWMTTTPAGWVTAAVAAIGLFTASMWKLCDIATITLEEQKEKLKETKEAYEDVKNELREFEDQLQNNINRIKELEALPNITWVEQEELDRLREATKELELQKQLKQDEQLKAAEDLYQENKKTFQQEFSSSYSVDGYNTSIDDLKHLLSSGDVASIQLHLDDNLIDIEAMLQYLNETKKQLTDTDEIEIYESIISNLMQSKTDLIKSKGEEMLSSLYEYKQNISDIASVRDLTEEEQATYDHLTSIRKMIYEFYSPATWNSLEFDSIFDTKGLEKTKEELIAMAKAGELSPETLQAFPKLSAAIKKSELIVEEGSDAFVEFYNELVALADKQQEIVTDTTKHTFTDTISQVQSLSTGLEKLGKIYTDVKNKEDFDWSSILNNEEFANTFSSMGTVYDNFIRTVSNAPNDIETCQEAFDKLATSYIYNTKDTDGNNIMDNLTESTKDATVAMLEQMGVVNALEVVEAELAKKEEILEVQRRYASEHATELIDATYRQANAYITEANCSEVAKKYLAQLYLQKNLFNGTEISTEDDCENLIQLAKTAGYSASVISRLQKLKQMYADNPIMSNVVKEDINRAIKNIFSEAEADIGGIDFGIQFDGSEAENSASSAAKSFTDLLDKELAVLDKKMEAGYIDFNDYIKARRDLIEDYYRQGKLAADEYYSYLEKHYKQELTYKDKVINAVTRRIDKEIDKLEKQKDDIESYYKVQIDALEKEKTLLQDANQERQREIDLQKAMYELERARNQRTKLIYSEDKGMHYVADDSAIRNAQQEVEDAEFEIKISEIEKAISKLEEARDAETEAIDDMIDKLEEYKDKWNDITSAYEESQEDLIAEQMLGRDWEKDILDTRLDTLNKFKDDYIAIQQAMVDAAYEAAKAMANAENVKIGDSSGDKSNGDDPEHGYEVVDEKTASRVGKGFTSEQKAKEYAKKLNEQKAKENGMTLAQFNDSDIPGYYVKKYHTGLKQGLVDQHSFDDDFKLVQEVGLGDKEVPAILKEGEAVATPEQISNIADGIRNNPTSENDDGTYVTPDGRVLRPYDPDKDNSEFAKLYKAWNAHYANIENPIEEISRHILMDHNKQMNEVVNQMINNTTNIVNNRNVQQPIVNQNITLNCPNLTNNSGIEYVQRELGHLSQMAMQEPLRKY